MSMSDEQYIRMEPIVGFRTWNILRPGILANINNQVIWPVRERIEAECVGGNIKTEHVAPLHGCSCGIYALKSDTGAEVLHQDLWGEVYLWGKVIEYEEGYKAQYAYPKRFFCLDTPNTVNRELVSKMADTYGVPLEIISLTDRLSIRDTVYKTGPWGYRPFKSYVPPVPLPELLTMLKDSKLLAEEKRKIRGRINSRLKPSLKAKIASLQKAQQEHDEVVAMLIEANKNIGDVEVKAFITQSKSRSPKPCLCGCGDMTKGGTYLPGHDSRHHAQLRREGK